MTAHNILTQLSEALRLYPEQSPFGDKVFYVSPSGAERPAYSTIAAAVAAAAGTTGAVIALTTGAYTLSAPVALLDGMRIVGSGPGTIVTCTGAGYSAFSVASGITNAGLVNFQLVGNSGTSLKGFEIASGATGNTGCLLYTSPSPRDH
jgi:hypothetical protein